MSAFPDVQLLSANGITDHAACSRHLREWAGAGAEVVWLMRYGICGDAGARAVADQ